jgi:hypothetical protein
MRGVLIGAVVVATVVNAARLASFTIVPCGACKGRDRFTLLSATLTAVGQTGRTLSPFLYFQSLRRVNASF